MEQHPIPQQISSYQFRLVGDMTLKQFFQVAGGALISLLIYATSLHPVVKWPLVLFSFGMGLALAFLPFEERPLSQWILSFFSSIYSPTVHLWKMPAQKYAFFKEEPFAENPEKGVIAPKGEVELNKYLSENPSTKTSSTEKLEKEEKTFLQKIGSLFYVQQPTKADEGAQKEPKPAPPRQVNIPQVNPVAITSDQTRPKIVIEERPLKVDEEEKEPKVIATKVDPTLHGEEIKGGEAEFSINAAPPLPPTIPNTLTGQVMDKDGKIIDGAIIEIRDMGGRPVRALRSNKAGHFIIVTALQNGFYEIITEKEGFEFEPISFEAKGKTIPPIAIRAKNNLENQNGK